MATVKMLNHKITILHGSLPSCSLHLVTTLSRTRGATISIGGLRMLHQGHVRLSLPENSITNLRAQIAWPCHPQTKMNLHYSLWFILMLLDWAVGWLLRPFVGSLAIAKERVGKGWSQGWGLVITFECGFNMLPLAAEALGWEVGGRSIFILFQAQRDHIMSGGFSLSRANKGDPWAEETLDCFNDFSQSQKLQRGIPFSNSGGLPFLHVTHIKSYPVLSSNQVLFSVLAGKKHARLVITANEVTNEQKVTNKKKWITSRRVVRRKYPERFRKNKKNE